MEFTDRELGWSSAPSLFRSRCVVVAEDDPELRALIERWLRYDGYEVESAADGDGLAQLLESRRHPDLVITDQRLPYRDGTDVLRELRRRGGQTPVVLMSGFADVGLHERARRLGVSAVVDKPFDLDAFRTLVAGLLAQRAGEEVRS
ncbi:MAG: response regulator [Myxococcaceae bacterium]